MIREGTINRTGRRVSLAVIWLFAAIWLVSLLVGGGWVLRPAPVFDAPSGWRYFAETGPVMDVLVEGQDLIIAGRSGLTRLRGGTALEPYDLPGFASSPVAYALARDAEGHVWLGHDAGVTVLTSDGATSLREVPGGPLREVRGLELDRENRVWIGGNGGVWRLEGDEAVQMLDGVRVLSLLLDSEGDVWVGTVDGLYLYRAQRGGWQSWHTEDGLPNRQVASLYQDRSGRVWVGTGFHEDGGTLIFAQDAEGWRISDRVREAQMAAPKTRSMFQDDRGNMWLGTETNGFSVISADGASQALMTGAQLPGNEVTSIGRSPEGGVWLGTLSGLVTLTPDAVRDGILAEF